MQNNRSNRTEGSVYFDKRLNRWVATVYRGLYQKPKAIYGPAGGAGGKSAVIAKRKDFLQAQARGEVIEVKRGPLAGRGQSIDNWGSTLGEWGTYWLDKLVKPDVASGALSPKTLENYRGIWDRQIAKRQIAKLKLVAVKRPQIIAWWDELKADGVGEATRDKAKTILGTALQAAVDRSDYTGVQANAATAFKLKERDRYRPKPKSAPDLDVAQDTLNAAEGDHQGIMLELGWSMGLRRGELAGLRWGDIDPSGTLKVQRHVIRVAGQGLVVRPGVKSGAPDSFKCKYFDPAVLGPLLAAHKQQLLEYRMQSGKAWTGPHPTADEAYLLPTRKGQVQDPQLLYRWFKGVAAAAGHASLTPHTMRHDFITTTLESGVSMWDTAQLAGHSSSTTTESVYAHARDSRLQAIGTAASTWLHRKDASEATG